MGSNLSTALPEPMLLRHINDTYPDLESLFDAGDAVESLLGHPGWAHVTRLLDAEVATIDRVLDGGDQPLSQAEYAMKHGRRGGVRAARDAAHAIVHRAAQRRQEQQSKHEAGAERRPEGT